MTDPVLCNALPKTQIITFIFLIVNLVFLNLFEVYETVRIQINFFNEFLLRRCNIPAEYLQAFA